MLDATRGLEAQDLNIVQLIQKNNKGLVVVVNKWDLIENKDANSSAKFEQRIKERLAPFTDFPVIFTSVVNKQRISTSKLNEFFLPLIENYPPPALKGKYIKIKYVMQLPSTSVPSFVFYANLPQYVKDPYKRFLENKLREQWRFTGTPVNIFVRQK